MASLLEVPLAVSTPSNNFPRSRFSLISFNSNVLIGQVCLLGSQVMNDVGAFTPPFSLGNASSFSCLNRKTGSV